MKIDTIIIVILIFMMSCKQKQHNKEQELTIVNLTEPQTVYNQKTYHKLKKKNKNLKITIIDTACINQTKRAKSDIKKGKLYYFYFTPWYESKEMAELLSEYNIELKYYSASCFEPPTGFKNNCYQEIMWSKIDSIIDRNKMDSLWKIAERNFVLKHPDSLYIKDGRDLRLKYLKK